MEHAATGKTDTRFALPKVEDYEPLINLNELKEKIYDAVVLLKDPNLRERLGRAARESVRARFLMPRLIEDWFDIIGAFETNFRLRGGAEGGSP